MDHKGLKLSVFFQSTLPIVAILFSGIDVIDKAQSVTRLLSNLLHGWHSYYHVLKQALRPIYNTLLDSSENQYVKDSLVNHN